MAEVLSQAQIDELLGSLQSGNSDIKEMEEKVITQKIKEYDFRSPKRISREQIKLLDSIFENYARLFGLQLSSMLRVPCEAQIIQIEEQQYYEFSNALNDSVLIACIDLEKDDGIEEKQILMEMARPISYSIIDRLLGGNGEGYNIERDYSEIELSLLEHMFKQLISIMTSAWSNYVDINAKYKKIETNSRLIQSVSPEETIVIIIVNLEIKKLSGNINICLPSNALKSIFKSFDLKFTKTAYKRGETSADQMRRDFIMGSLQDSNLTVTGILGNTEITLQDLLQLQMGDIFVLDTPVKANSISVKVKDVPWFKGTLGVKKQKYAVKIGEKLD